MNTWIKNTSESFLFDEVINLAQKLDLNEIKNEAIHFPSALSLTDLKLVLACWLRGLALVPLAKNVSNQQKERLIDCAKSCSFDSVSICSNVVFHEPIELDLAKTACFIQTSGSVNLPKIVAIKNRQLLAASKTTSHWIKTTKTDTWLLNLPLHHIGGLSILFRAWFSRFQVEYEPNFTLSDLKKHIEKGSAQFISLVPTQLKRLLDVGLIPHSDFKMVLLGGGPCSEKVLQNGLNVGLAIVTSFGMTETAAQFTGNLYKAFEKINSVQLGKPAHENQIKITSENPPYLPANEGLLWIKGEQISTEYASGDDLLIENGWFCTEDFARFDSDKNLEILMRRSDRIVSGGENINPIEIENYLNQTEGILDCVVVGIPDEEWGQKVVALIQAEKKYFFDKNELKTQLKSHLEAFKIPKEFINVDEIPRISISKLDRKRALILAQTQQK